MKWKNYGLWTSIASVLYIVLKDMGFQINFTEWQTYITLVLGILVTLGIVSNPENGKGFFNSKQPPSSDPSKQQSSDQEQSISSIEYPQDDVPDRKYTPYEK